MLTLFEIYTPTDAARAVSSWYSFCDFSFPLHERSLSPTPVHAFAARSKIDAAPVFLPITKARRLRAVAPTDFFWLKRF